MRNSRAIFAAAFLGFAADRILKQYALEAAAAERGVFVWEGALGLRLHINEFFAGSFPVPNSAALLVMAIVIAMLLYVLYTKRAHAALHPLALVLAGAASNAIDRAAYGGVVDYLVIPFGGVVNLADALVVLGVVLVIAPHKRYAR